MVRASLLSFALLCLALPAHAQTLPGTSGFDLVLSPAYPAPNDTVTVTPQSSSIDLIGSSVSFSVNGAVVEKGTGGQAFQTRVGGVGEKTTITATVTASDGSTYAKTLTIRPADVALVVEPVSTVHPFYRGGSQVGSEGSVRLVAMTDFRGAPGSRIAPSALSYTWRVGDQVLTSSSGLGRSTLIATAPVRYRDATVSVTVTNADQSIVGYATTRIAPVAPIVRIYENDPLLGPLFDRALSGAFAMTESETTFRAVPYFFAADPALSWLIGGSAGGNGPDVTVRSTGDGAGTASVSLSASDAAKHQSASSQLSVGFGSAKKLGIFGL